MIRPAFSLIFDSKTWYSGTVDPANFDPASMSQDRVDQHLPDAVPDERKRFPAHPQLPAVDTTDSQSSVQIISGGSDVQILDDTPAAPIISTSSTGANVRYTTAGVNMRAQAVSGSTIVAVVMEGVGVTVTGQTVNGWVPVSCSGYSGYIYQDYLA